MKSVSGVLVGLIALAATTSASWAAICDYRPSQLIGEGAAASAETAGASVAAAGVGLKAAGFYTLVHASSGATMLASTAGGASAAGTVGIMGGTAGAVGTGASILMSPVVIGTAILGALGAGGMKVGCYFQDERITDFAKVRALVDQRVASASPSQMGTIMRSDGPWLWLREADGTVSAYAIKDLYVVNGELMHRDWGANTSLGKLW